MSEAKFTKGEWVSEFNGTWYQINSIIDDDANWIADTCASSCDGRLEIGKYNAHLIAAAPEMYEEIERDIKWLEQMKAKFVLGSYEYRSICLRIESKQELLAKARGEHNE